MKKLLFIVILFLWNYTNAQISDVLEDYFVSITGDTIYGEIHTDPYSLNKLKFQNGNSIVTISADQIISYKKGLKECIVQEVNDMPAFTHIVIDGPIKLYEVGDKFINPYSYYIIEKDGEVMNSRTLWFDNQANVAKLFADYKALKKAINNKEFSFKDLPEIIHIYNNWVYNGKPEQNFITRIEKVEEITYDKWVKEGEKVKLISKPASPSQTTPERRLYIVKNNSDKEIRVKGKNLANSFKDNKFLHEKIVSGYYNIYDIETIVYLYNHM